MIQELVGKGTFGQVVKCTVADSPELYAVKVVKNKPAYTQQACMEIKIFQELMIDGDTPTYIVHMKDYFVFRSHICIVFELMSYSLFDLMRMTKFTGLGLSLIQGFAKQMLSGLVLLERNKIIHCDLKPENVLLVR